MAAAPWRVQHPETGRPLASMPWLGAGARRRTATAASRAPGGRVGTGGPVRRHAAARGNEPPVSLVVTK
jgi:hypothetical protein